MEPVSCIIPAAGRSERMGQWKLLLPFQGSTIVQVVVRVALAACSHVIVVTGYRGQELQTFLQGNSRLTIVDNPGWQMGMFSSIQQGAVFVDTDRFFITLGDKPFIKQDAYERLWRAPAADAIFPTFTRQRGHPVLLSRAARDAVLAANARSASMPLVLSNFMVKEIEWPDDSVIRDIDTPEQYEAARRPD